MKYFLISFLILFGFVQIAQAQTATLSFSPSTVVVSQGEAISIDVMVNTSGEAVNAIGAYFTYPADKLDFLEVQTADSVMTLFAEQTGTNGLVQISGGKPTPGFSGVHKVASVRFLAKALGAATLTFTADAVVLRNSDNQDVLNRISSGRAVITIISSSVPVPPVIPPTSSPSVPTIPTTTGQVPFDEVIVSDVTENSAVISWKTEIPSISKIVYDGKTLFDGAVTTDHRIVLSGLTADTPYTFQVVGQAGDGQFRTQAVGSQGQEQGQVQEKMRDFFNRVPGGLITVLILLVLTGGSVFFLIIRLRG